MSNKSNLNLDKQALILKILNYVLFTLTFLYTLFIIIGRFIEPIKTLAIFTSLDIFTANKTYNVWLRSLSYIIIILSISSLIRHALTFSFNWLKHGKSIISLFTSFIKYVAVIIIIFLILATFGVDTTALIAGIGILSLIVGLAIQPLLQDIIAGIFIVFEKTYDIGDVVVIDNFRGTVTEIGIRTTKIKDAGGDIKVINNSDIRTLVNMTGDLSIAISDVDIEYSESLERVEEVIANNLNIIKEKIPTIIDGPYYKGVASLGTSGVKLRIVAKCKEDSKFQTQRDINRQIKLIFDENNINIPFTQVVVHEATKKAPIKKTTGKTDKFVLEQNVLSGNIDDEDVNKN